MAVPVKRTARKDYPNQGIKKGDEYHYVQLKTGPRSSLVLRSLKPFKQSQLTTSAFKKAWFSADEAYEDSDKDEAAIRAAADSIREAGEDAREAFDNMPEGLQQGDTGQTLDQRADKCEEVADALNALADEFEALDEPVEPEGDDEDAQDTYDKEQAEFEQERDRIQEEAGDLLADMPD